MSLETFTDKNVIRVGVAVRCPHCSQENWYDLKRLDYVVGCERCLREFAFPQGSLKYGSEDWRFRVVGPFTLPDYALGAYSTVLTLRALGYALRNGREPMTYSTGLNLEWGGRTAEVDFVAWYKQQAPFWLDPEPELVFGETKSFGTEVFHDKDIERLRALAIRFPGAYFVMATLKAKLGTPEVERLRKFAKWGRASHRDRMRAGVIVLTSVELFSEWQIARTWEGLGGPFARFAKGARVRLDDLWTLADVTQQLYLGLPSQDDVLRVRWQRKASKAATPAP